jgi:hypothetical protein
MATITRTRLKDNTADVTATGMNINQLDRGDWLQNLYLQDGSINVREGFGQVARFSSELNTKNNIIADGVQRGFDKVLGSYFINTDFGHDQIITVLSTVAWSADIASASLASTKSLYSVVIYDVTTDTKKEIVLYEHTSRNQSEQVPLYLQQGHYETNSETDHQEWKEGSKDIVFFTEYSDRVYFGSERMGVWCYTPSIFTKNENYVSPQVTRTFAKGQHESTYRSEDAVITQLSFNENKVFTGESINLDGSTSQITTYATNSQIGNITDATTFYGRLVYASGRTIWFSDVNKPNSVAAGNFIGLDSEEEITAIQALRDSIIIYTPNETYLYLPSNDPFLVTGGRLYQLSKNVGCISAQAKVRIGDGVMWVDRNGFWTNNGDVKIDKISTVIEPFFNTFVSRPLTNFFKNNGGKGTSGNGQKINIDTTGSGIHVVYEPEQERVFFVFPDENFAWVLESGGYKLWTWKTIANNGDEDDISETENILQPRLVPNGRGGIYLAGGMDNHITFIDDGRGVFVVRNKSFYILEWKRGGGVDRSNVPQEDKVSFTGEYYNSRVGATTDTARMVLDKPVPVPVGTPIYSQADPGGAAYIAEENTYLVPVRWLGSETWGRQLIQNLDCEFEFDNVNFNFVFDPTNPGTPNVLVVVPTERGASAWGWTLGNSTFLPPFAYVATFQAGAPSQAGNNIRIRWNGQNGYATNPWSYPDGAGGGYLNTAQSSCQTLFYLVMKKVGTGTDPRFAASTTSGGAWQYTDSTASTYDISSIIWKGCPYDDGTMTEDQSVQPVEWVFKTKQIGEGDVNLKARGITTTMLSTGKSSTPIFPNWVYGLYNTLLGSDQKEWATQVVDLVDPNGQQDKNLQNIKRIVNKDTTIPRLRSATQQPTVSNAYGNAAATWASLADGTDGTVLSSNNAVNNITQSDSVRGGRFSYTLFGFVQNKAEKLKFNTMKVAMRVVGALRRR